MAEINKWSQSASGNTQNSPDGWKEGMTRTQVNDTARETHASIRRWYDDAEFVQLHDSPLGANTVTRESTSSVRVAATPNAPAIAQYPVGCRVRIGHVSGTLLEANVTARVLAGSDLIVTIDSTSIAADANSIRRFISKSVRSAAFRSTGIASGQIPLFEQFGNAAFINEGHGNGLDADTLDGQHGSYYEGLVGTAAPRPNLLLNGNMQLWQRAGGATFTIDNTGQYQAVDGGYTADGWKYLVDSGAANIVKFDRDTDAPAGFAFSMKITAVAPTGGPASEKFGICQMLERADCAPAFGGAKVVSLSWWAKTNVGSTLTRIRGAVLSWNGGADTPTADPVNVWNAEGTDPGLVAGAWAYENTSTLLTLTSSWQQFKIENILIDTANVANLAVFIWLDDKSYVGAGTPDIVWITGVKLEIAATASDFLHRPMGDELARAQRYFTKTFDQGVKPAQNIGLVGSLLGQASSNAGRDVMANWRFSTPMFKTPTIVTYNPSLANANWSNNDVPSVTNIGTGGVSIDGGTAVSAQVSIHATAEAVL